MESSYPGCVYRAVVVGILPYECKGGNTVPAPRVGGNGPWKRKLIVAQTLKMPSGLLCLASCKKKKFSYADSPVLTVYSGTRACLQTTNSNSRRSTFSGSALTPMPSSGSRNYWIPWRII